MWLIGVLTVVTAILIPSYFLYKKFQRKKAHEIEVLRTRIASDLHDEIGSSLGSIALMADYLSEKFTQDDSGFRRLKEMSDNARQMSDSIREIIWFVDSQKSSIDDLADRFRSITTSMLPRTVETLFSAKNESATKTFLTMEQKRSLLFLFKEIVHNIARHAHASRVTVLVLATQELLNVRVSDNGCGFNHESIKKGNGLVNLHRRVHDLHGECSIKSIEGDGTIVTLSIPLHP